MKSSSRIDPFGWSQILFIGSSFFYWDLFYDDKIQFLQDRSQVQVGYTNTSKSKSRESTLLICTSTLGPNEIRGSTRGTVPEVDGPSFPWKTEQVSVTVDRFYTPRRRVSPRNEIKGLCTGTILDTIETLRGSVFHQFLNEGRVCRNSSGGL